MGNARIASYIVKKLREDQTSQLRIREFEIEIKNIIPNIVGDFLAETKTAYSETKAVLLFLGFDPLQKKKVNINKFSELLEAYQKFNQKKTDEILRGRSIKELSENEIKKLNLHTNSTKQGIKRIIADSLKKNRIKNNLLELLVSDQHIFSVEIKDSEFSYKEYQYGECAVYGGGLNPDILSSNFLGHLDLNINSGNFFHDSAAFVHSIYDNFSGSIGGSVTSFAILV